MKRHYAITFSLLLQDWKFSQCSTWLQCTVFIVATIHVNRELLTVLQSWRVIDFWQCHQGSESWYFSVVNSTSYCWLVFQKGWCYTKNLQNTSIKSFHSFYCIFSETNLCLNRGKKFSPKACLTSCFSCAFFIRDAKQVVLYSQSTWYWNIILCFSKNLADQVLQRSRQSQLCLYDVRTSKNIKISVH